MNTYLRIWGIVLVFFAAGALFAQSDGSSEYRMSSGDQIAVSVFGEGDLAVSQKIDDLGKIVMPLLGEVILTGMTVREAEEMIEQRFMNEDYLVKPEVTVQVTGSKARQFYIFGEVNSAGMKTFPSGKSHISVIEAISLAGDLSDFARSNEVLITRRTETGQEVSIEVDVRELIRGTGRGGNRDEVRILPGDVIYVPARRL